MGPTDWLIVKIILGNFLFWLVATWLSDKYL